MQNVNCDFYLLTIQLSGCMPWGVTFFKHRDQTRESNLRGIVGFWEGNQICKGGYSIIVDRCLTSFNRPATQSPFFWAITIVHIGALLVSLQRLVLFTHKKIFLKYFHRRHNENICPLLRVASPGAKAIIRIGAAPPVSAI